MYTFVKLKVEKEVQNLHGPIKNVNNKKRGIIIIEDNIDTHTAY